MPKQRVTLTRWVLENVTVEVEAEDLREAFEKADQIYKAGLYEGQDLKWKPSTDNSVRCKAGNRYAKAG